ncbi:gamma-mobile-trio protein GmtX [Rhizobium leguminosarum]
MSTAEKLYERLLAERTSDSQRNKMTGLWNALRQMRDENVDVYTIAVVGSYSEKCGGPQTQSIRNKQGKPFRTLIEAFADDEGKRIKRPQKSLPPIDAAIDMIADKGAQLALRLEIKANAGLKAENDRLKAAFKVLSVVPTVERSLNQPETPRPKLSEIELDSINRFLAGSWREERLWLFGDDGSIVEEPSGTLIAPPGFVNALRDILATLD